MHLTLLRKLDGVAGEMAQDLPESGCISYKLVGNTQIPIEGDSQALCLSLGSVVCPEICYQFVQGEGLLHAFQLARFQPAKIKYSFDNATQSLGRLFYCCQVVTLLLSELGLQPKVSHPDDSIHRSAQFMAHIGEKLASHGKCCFQFAVGLTQICRVLFNRFFQLGQSSGVVVRHQHSHKQND